MTVGVPKEIKGQEYRVALLPSAAYQLIKRGHEVIVFTEGAEAEKIRQLGFEVFTHGMKRSINPLMALRTVWRIRIPLETAEDGALVEAGPSAGPSRPAPATRKGSEPAAPG